MRRFIHTVHNTGVQFSLAEEMAFGFYNVSLYSDGENDLDLKFINPIGYYRPYPYGFCSHGPLWGAYFLYMDTSTGHQLQDEFVPVPVQYLAIDADHLAVIHLASTVTCGDASQIQ